MRCTTLTAAITAAVFLFIPTTAFSQVEVVESSPTLWPSGQKQGNQQANGSGNAGSPGSSDNNMQAQLYYQLQTLQQEVAQLRGMVEEQAHELEQLKQQRLDDYVNLDRRISELSGGDGQSPSNDGAGATASDSSQAGPTSSAPAGSDEFKSYNAAMDLIRAKKYDQAITAFNDYIDAYPEGQYTADSYHWLGQLHQLRNNRDQARESYNQVVSEYPDHDKAPDAKLKLGQLYFQQGDKQKAKSLLEEVAATDSDEARLAENFLTQNF